MDIGGRHYDINETILSFEQVELSQIKENKERHAATGGYNDNLLIEWENDKEISFAVSHGVLSPISWAVLSNSKIGKEQIKSVAYKETLDVIEDNNSWYINLKFIPNGTTDKYGIQGNPEGEQMPMGRREWLPLKPICIKDKFIFCYDCDTGQRIMKFDIVGNRIVFKKEHRRIMVDYTFDYKDKMISIDLGNQLFTGFLNLTGKISYKDERTGETKTAIIEIPRLKMRSAFAAKLGNSYDCATISDFFFTGYPPEDRLNQKVCNITFLSTELTGEYL